MLPAGQRRQPKARLPVAIQAGCIPTNFPATLSLHHFHRSTGTKPAQRFERLPLKGLWKKHYLIGGLRSYAVNLKAGAGKRGREFKKIVKSRHTPDTPPQEVAKNIADDICQIYAGRAQAQELTGEWIIFAKHEGKNYYLCLATHTQGDDEIFRMVRDGCVGEFPFLRSLLHQV